MTPMVNERDTRSRFERTAQKVTQLVLNGIDMPVAFNSHRLEDPQIYDPHFFKRLMKGGSLELGHMFVEGGWNCERLDVLAERLMSTGYNHPLVKKMANTLDVRRLVERIRQRFVNEQEGDGSYAVGESHYDKGNDMYEAMLDPHMMYSCGWWGYDPHMGRDVETLQEAQEAKLRLIAEKLKLTEKRKDGKPLRVLDIGCGWGGAAEFFAREYGVEVVGITISKEQEKLARERCKGLDVEIRFQRYQDLPKGEKYDRIYSIGMVEHVGSKNYREYMEMVHDHLVDGGLTLTHTITKHDPKPVDPWFKEKMWENSVIPGVTQITGAARAPFADGSRLHLEDMHEFGVHYDPTLMAWYENLVENWDKLSRANPQKYNEAAFREMKYYLLMSAGSFRARANTLHQFVYSKNRAPGYEPVRYEAPLAA